MNGEKHNLEQQARNLFPYPECNQWAGIPPEYIRDCLIIDDKRAAWVEEQLTHPSPHPQNQPPL